VEKIAVIGSGISGLAAARALTQAGTHRVTLFEAGAHFGGHAHTVEVTLDGCSHGVDTGFLVYNERTYPQLVRMFRDLGVPTALSEMSFSVQARSSGLEWSGVSLGSVFAQRKNLLRPAFWGMLADILRFNRLCTGIAQRPQEAQLEQPIGVFLDRHGFGLAFREGYFLPMIACIWSCTTQQMLAFPVATLIRFCHNHGLLQIANRPQWRSVAGGSQAYVQRIVAGLHDARLRTPVRSVKRREQGVLLQTECGSEAFDQVVFACHSDQALRLLAAHATPEELQLLGAIRYQPNRAVLHTDASVLPSRRSAWAAWNYESAGGEGGERVCLHYLINQLQPLPWQRPVLVSLNPVRAIAPEKVIQCFDYEHPVFDLGAIAAQKRLPQIQGQRRSWYCGAWTGYGFHEDGLASGLTVAESLLHASALAQRLAA
jgi:predicted NAD/FAD-binding protein